MVDVKATVQPLIDVEAGPLLRGGPDGTWWMYEHDDSAGLMFQDDGIARLMWIGWLVEDLGYTISWGGRLDVHAESHDPSARRDVLAVLVESWVRRRDGNDG